MSPYKLAALKSVGGVALVFYGIPIFLLVFVLPSKLPSLIYAFFGFIFPLLFASLTLAEFAGNAAIRSKGYVFLYTISCFIFATICFSSLNLVLFPPSSKKIEFGDFFEVLNGYYLLFIFLGLPACVLAGIFFIGALQQKRVHPP